jgi:hypothetical protein
MLWSEAKIHPEKLLKGDCYQPFFLVDTSRSFFKLLEQKLDQTKCPLGEGKSDTSQKLLPLLLLPLLLLSVFFRNAPMPPGCIVYAGGLVNLL